MSSHSNLIKFGTSSDLSHGSTSFVNPDNTDHSVNQLAGDISRNPSHGINSSTAKSGEVTHENDTVRPSNIIPATNNNKVTISNSPVSQKYTIPATVSSSYAIPNALLSSHQQPPHEIKSNNNRSKLKNENEISYRLTRGVITLLDGSNKEIRACAECHRKRAGVEHCRLVRLHPDADWDDDRPTPEPITLPAGMTFKRVGGVTETVLKPIIGGQNRKPVSISHHRASQSSYPSNNNKSSPPMVIHPITALAAKFQLTGRQFRELPRPPFEEDETPIEQLIRLEQRVNQMQANVTTLLSMTHGSSNSVGSNTLGNMDQFFVPLKEKIAAAKANRQTVKEIMLFAEVSLFIYIYC